MEGEFINALRPLLWALWEPFFVAFGVVLGLGILASLTVWYVSKQ